MKEKRPDLRVFTWIRPYLARWGMYRVLVVDDEKLEREGIRFLLSMEEGEWEIYEAANGKLALNELRKHPVDLMLTDIKMPHMDGLELSKKAREEYPDLEIIIFSGYGDFAFAQEAIRYGVTDYVLKPVDPDRFHDTIQKIQKEIASRKNKEQQSIKEKSFLQQYFLQSYLYSGDRERLKEAEGIVDFAIWEQWHCAILIESDESFFDSASDEVPLEIQAELRRSFFYLNLNGRQSMLLFKDVYCDYTIVAKNVYSLLKRLHPARFHLAVSRRFDGYRELPGIMEQLEQQMEEKFYHPDIHIYTSEEEEEKNTGEEEQDSRLMEKISEDISRKDVKQLWSHFHSLASKYQSNTQFSAMYVKFVFSNVIRELFQENRFAGEHRLDLEVDHLYGCSTIQEIIEVTEKNIRQYEAFLERSMSESRDEVAAVKNYIYNHYAEDLNLETLAEKVYLSSGYLSFIFKKETGMNLNRFIRVFRMEKAKELLCTTNMKVAMVSEKVGFANSSYFCRSFREYYGSSPESYRKGNNEDEEASEEV